jgi:ADP-ribose pyrophosphatase YjhB (NUDIX family)
MVNKSVVLIGAACVVREGKNKKHWLLVKQNKDDIWEIPKTVVRKGESSARSVIRMTAEKGGMTTKIIEEAGRAGGATTINGKNLPQRTLYYLMVLKNASKETLGFYEAEWFEYAKAVRNLPSKRERMMLKSARETHRKWLKESRKKNGQEE